MNTLLKSYGLTDKAIRLYREGLGKFPYTLSEIKKYMPKLSDDTIKNITNELIEKKLVILIKPKYSEAIPHYIFLPPFAAAVNSLVKLSEPSNDKVKTASKRLPEIKILPKIKPLPKKKPIPKMKPPQSVSKKSTPQIKKLPTKSNEFSSEIEKFQNNLFQDIENVSQDLITAITDQVDNNQTTEILSEVEQNVKKFVQVIIDDIIKAISALRRETTIDQRDLVRLYKTAKQKLEDAEEITTNMFSQFRDIVKEMQSSSVSPQVESFKSFIRTLGLSIDKRVHEISFPTPVSSPSQESVSLDKINSISLDKIKSIEKSLFNVLADYITKNRVSLDKFWNVNSYEKIKEVISFLLENSKKELLIIVPNIEMFIPLEKLNLDYSEDHGLTESIQSSGPKRAKPKKPTGPSISKKQKQEVEKSLEAVSKKVSELKGYELSHNIAELLGLVSEVNPKSVIIESVQGWLNRLLVIRKNLDPNTQYLFLEALEKWKKEYLKVQKEEEPEDQEDIESKETSTGESSSKLEAVEDKFKIIIISSEPHNNKHVIALKMKENIEYLQIKKNNIIGIVGDNSYLVFGVGQKVPLKPIYKISGFLTNFEPLVHALYPQISKLRSEAKPPKEIQINEGFNEIIENINDYSGKQMANKLQALLNVAFEKDGISLQVLELKLLKGKLEKILYSLEDEMKDYVIKELNKLNKELSPFELMYPPEFRPPIAAEKVEVQEEIIPEEREIEPLDPEKINYLFEIFLEKIQDLKGVEIVEQIDKFIEVVLKLQGYSSIIEWKNTLREIDKELELPFKEKIKEDFLQWKWGILHQTPPTETPLAVGSQESYSSPKPNTPGKKEDTISILDDGYISPGLAQTQFETEGESSSGESLIKEDPGAKMEEYFEQIQNNLGEMTGLEISKALQNIVDIILETQGYSMALKGSKDWISKLRMIRKPLEPEFREDFEVFFLKWKEKYSKDEEEAYLDFGASSETTGELSDDLESSSEEGLSAKFESLLQNTQTLNGNDLSKELQGIADIVLLSHGAVAANAIRQWISKLRSIRSPLEEKIKDEFITELTNWKEKFS